jgi:peptide/nickel transport system substrate-binding protein
VRVQTGKALLAGVAALALALTACSSSGGNKPANGSSGGATSGNGEATALGTGAFASCVQTPNTCNSGTAKHGGTVTYVLEKTIPGWNINTGNSGVFELAEVEDAILPGVYNTNPDLKPFLNTDLMVSADQQVSNGVQKLIYKIQPNAVWSDGQPINFDDFKYLADANNPAICPDCAVASSAGYTSIKSMASSDNGKTVTITMKTPFADWQSMFGNLLPAHIASQHGDIHTAKGLASSFLWFDQHVPTFSGGALLIKNYVKDQSVTEVPNPKYYAKDKSPLDQVIFRIITDQAQEVPALQNHEVDAIYPQPTQDIVTQAKGLQGVQTDIGTGLVWEHFDLNEANKFLKDHALRLAIFTAIDRKALIARTVGTFAPQIRPVGNHIYLPGQPGYQDNVTSTGQGSGDVAKAKQILTQAGYKGVGSSLMTPSGQKVSLSCLHSQGNTLRQTECEIVQQTLAQLGIPVTLKTTSDLHELASGQFDIVVFAWQGTPFVIAGAQQIWELKGGGDYGKNNDPQVEQLINQAATQTNPQKVIQMLNQADQKLTADAYVLPLYPKPSFLAANTNVVNIRNNATSVGPPYNVQAWGLKS